MKEFVCYRVKNLILPNIDIMKINRERKKKKCLKGRNNLQRVFKQYMIAVTILCLLTFFGIYNKLTYSYNY